MMEVVIVPDADFQIRAIDGWWRENRSASPGLFAEELAAAIDMVRSSPRIGRRRRHKHVPGLRRVLLRATRYHLYYAQRIGRTRCDSGFASTRLGGFEG